MATIRERSQYKADGRMRWSRAPLLLLVPFLVAIAGGFALNWVFMRGWYYVVIVPLIVSGLVTASMWVMVGWTHCRKPWLAAAVGLLVGSSCYLSYYQFGLAQTFPPGFALRVDLLPKYIKFRLDTDVEADPGIPKNKPPEPDRFMNWFTFIYEFAIIAGMTAEASRRRAHAAYDSSQDCWMEKEHLIFPVGVRDELATALDFGSTESCNHMELFCQTHRPLASNPQNVACTVQLEYTQAEVVSPLQRPIYLTASENPIRTWFSRFFRRSDMLDQTEITREEAVALQPMFVGFDKLLREWHAELRELPLEVPGQDCDVVHEATSHAVIEPIVEQDQCGIYSGWNLFVSNLIGGGMLVGFIGGPVVCYLAYHFNMTLGIAGAVAVVLVGIAMFFAAIYVGTCCPTAFELAYLKSRMARCIDGRAGAIVKPGNADTIFVGFTERGRWKKVRLEVMTDAGFAKFDFSDRTLRLECDAERMEIHGTAIVQCQAESLNHPLDKETEHWLVRLVVQIPSGKREILIEDGTPRFGRNNNLTRRDDAESLVQKIMSLCQA